MRTIIKERNFEVQSLTSIISFELNGITVKDKDKPQVLSDCLIDTNELSSSNGVIKTNSLYLGINLLFLATCFCIFILIVILIQKQSHFYVSQLTVLYSQLTNLDKFYRYFKVILFSPTPKSKWVTNIILFSFN